MRTFLALFLVTVLVCPDLWAASNKRVPPRYSTCQIKANFAAEVFDLVTENPKVILSGMDADAINTFTFVRQWVKDGKSRTDLVALIWSQCPDSV